MTRVLFPCVLAAVLAGCVSRPVREPAGSAAAGHVAPALVVERFLTAANVVAQRRSAGGASAERVKNALAVMARLFGNRDGSLVERDPAGEVERRMYLLADILRHDDYAVEGEQAVPGRTDEAVEVLVRLHIGERRVTVPFTVVRSRRDGWLVEQVEVERILGPSRP